MRTAFHEWSLRLYLLSLMIIAIGISIFRSQIVVLIGIIFIAIFGTILMICQDKKMQEKNGGDRNEG